MKLIDRIRIGIRDDVGPTIKAAREERGVTLQALADEVGVCKSTIMQVECGNNKVSVELLVAIAHALDTTIDALVPVLVSTD